MNFHDPKIELYMAINSKKIETVRQILSINPMLCHSSGCDIKVPSPLWLAMILGYDEIVDSLVEFGADVNEWLLIDENVSSHVCKLSFFHYIGTTETIFQSNINVAKVLIKYKANVNITYDLTSKLPIQLAILRGNTLAVEFFLQNGAKLDGPEWDKCWTCLCILEAPSVKQKEILLLLLKHGLNTEFRSEGGESILHIVVDYACQKNYDARQIIGVLLDHTELLYEINDRGQSPFELAILLKNVALTSFFIERGVDVNKNFNHDGSFPLSLAASGGEVDLVKLLVSSGSAINSKTPSGHTALHLACLGRHLEVITFLIQSGSDITVTDYDGNTPLSVLDPFEDRSKQCINILIKEISALIFKKTSVNDLDMKIVKGTPELQNFFENCLKDLLQMSLTKFYPPYSYYYVLKESRKIKKLANLMKNEDFVTNFQKKLSTFYYKDDLKRIFYEANQLKDRMLIVDSRLNSIFKDLFPRVVINKLAENLTIEDLPLK